MSYPTPADQTGQGAPFVSHSPRINEIKSIPLLRAVNYDTSAAAKHKEYFYSSAVPVQGNHLPLSRVSGGHSSYGEADGMGDSYQRHSENSFQQMDRQKQVRLYYINPYHRIA